MKYISIEELKRGKIKLKKRKSLKKWGLFLTIFLFFLIIAGGLLYLFYLYQNLPDPTQIGSRVLNQSTKIYDRTGQILLYEIHGEEKRTFLPFQEIPDHVKVATLAIEDINFYEHPAFDWRALIRAILINLKHGRIVQGGSTITQQVVKNTFLTPERTFQRKLKEIILAVKLEKKYSKDQILELYLNQVFYGSNAYGIEAAAQTFFSKSARELTVAEAAILAALPKAPSYYSPYGSHQKQLFARKDYILERMKEFGYLDEEEFKRAKEEKITFAPRYEKLLAPHFVMYVKDYLEEKYGEEFIETAGLKVITTLDWELQQLAEKVVAEGAKRNEELYQGKNAALIAQDPKTGQILAMVGSRDYFDIANEGNFNVITAHRQPGSAFKPFAYLTLFKKGYPPETILFDVKTEFNPYCSPSADQEKDIFGRDCYHPNNFDLKFRGPVDLRHALAQSINVPAVKVLYLAGLEETLKTAQKFGLTTLTDPSRYGLSLVLGGGDVRPIEMVQAFSIFAQDGIKHKQTAILKVIDPQGKILEEYQDETETVEEPQYIRIINDILSDNEARIGLFSPGNLLELPPYQVAAKTGTSQDYRDAWTVGYTPFLVTVVWAGNNDFTPMVKGGASILAAVPIWHNFMKEALKKYPPENFPKPEPMPFPEKPMLNGEYVTYLKIGENLYPQIHCILYWINRNDPLGPIPQNPSLDSQFNNWETAVLEWAKNNLPNFNQYNQPLPLQFGELLIEKQKPIIDILSPLNGEYLEKNQLILNFSVKSAFPLKVIEIYFNNQLLKEITSFPNENYQLNLSVPNLEIQNELKIKASDQFNNSNETTLILFKK